MSNTKTILRAMQTLRGRLGQTLKDMRETWSKDIEESEIVEDLFNPASADIPTYKTPPLMIDSEELIKFMENWCATNDEERFRGVVLTNLPVREIINEYWRENL